MKEARRGEEDESTPQQLRKGNINIRRKKNVALLLPLTSR
jgi:hypothetical protein